MVISTIENLNLTLSIEICKEISFTYLKECINGILYGIFYFGNVNDLAQCEHFAEPFRGDCIETLREYARLLVT